MINHGVASQRGVPAGVGEAVTQLHIMHAFRLGSGIAAVVREIIAFGLAMAQGVAEVSLVSSPVEGDARLGVDEVILLLDFQTLIAIAAVGILQEAIVDAIRKVADMAILHIAIHIQCGSEVYGGLCKHLIIALCSVGVVILIVTILEEHGTEFSIGSIGQVAPMVALEILQRCAADEVEPPSRVVHVPAQSVNILRQSLLPHEVRLLQRLAVCEDEGCEAELAEFVVRAELIIVSMPVCIV